MTPDGFATLDPDVGKLSGGVSVRALCDVATKLAC
jgi:hypothetical protein